MVKVLRLHGALRVEVDQLRYLVALHSVESHLALHLLQQEHYRGGIDQQLLYLPVFQCVDGFPFQRQEQNLIRLYS